MSFMSALVDAAKNAVKRVGETPQDPIVVGNSGSHTPQDDGREFRQPPPGTGGKPAEEPAVEQGDSTPVANLNVGSGPRAPIEPPSPGGGTQGPKGPEAPTEPTPGGGDGGIPTKPSAPFDPKGVIFNAAGGEGQGIEDASGAGSLGTFGDVESRTEASLNSGGVNPIVIARDRALGNGATEDPDAGGEVARGIQPGKGAGYIGETEKDLKVSEAGGESDTTLGGGQPTGVPEGHVPGGGSGLERGIPEGHVPGGGSGIERGIPEGHVPGGGSGLERGIPEGHVPGGEDEPLGDGGNTGILEDPDAGGEIEGRLRAPLELKLSEDLKSSDPEEGGEITELRRPPTGFKPSDDTGVTPIDNGGEVFSEVKFKIEAPYLKFGEYKVEPEYKPEGDIKVEGGIKFEGSKFDDTHNFGSVAPPTGPSGIPTPYPNVDDGGPDLGESLARKAGGEQQEYFKVKMEDVLVTSTRQEGEPPNGDDELPDDEGSGVTDWIAKKRGKGGLGFLEDEPEVALLGEETSAAVDGESQDTDHKFELDLARRTEVKDSHDRPADVETQEPKPIARLADEDDDDFESDTLLDLKPSPAAGHMLPGLAGVAADGNDLDVDADTESDANESEL